jgi:hypothetical protein
MTRNIQAVPEMSAVNCRVSVMFANNAMVTTISSYTLKITVTIAHVTSHTKSSNSSSGHTAAPLELRNSSEVKVKVKVTL